MRVRWAVVFLSSLLLANLAEAAPPKVAVIVTTEVNLGQAESDQLASKLGEAIEGVYLAEAIPTEDVRRLAPSIAPSCASDPGCSSQLGSRLGVDFIVFLAAVKLGGQVQLDPVWASMKGGVFAMRQRVAVSAAVSDGEVKSAIASIVPEGELERRSARSAGKTERHMTTAAWVAGGTAIGLLVTGAGFATWAVVRSDDCEIEGGCTTDERQQQKDDVSLGALLADISVGAALLAGATAIVIYYSSDSGEEPLRVGLTTPAGGLGLGVSGRF